MFRTIRKRLRERETRKELRAMSDRDLRDIGIDRADIETMDL